MGRVRGTGTGAEGSNAARKSAEAFLKEVLDDCIEVLKDNPTSRAMCLKYLGDIGFKPKPKEEKKAARSVVLPSAQTAGRMAAQEKKAEQKKEEKEKRAAEGEVKLPSSYNKVEKFTAAFLAQRVLPQIDKKGLSDANINKMFKKQGITKAPAKQDLLQQILEFLTGDSPSMSLLGDKSTFEGYYRHIAEAVDLRQRQQTLELPPDWQEAGVYRLSFKGAQIIITHRFSYEKLVVDFDDFKVAPLEKNDVMIGYNWSETSAELTVAPEKQPRGFKTIKIGIKFSDHSSKKRRLAVADAPSPASSKKSRKSSSSPAST